MFNAALLSRTNICVRYSGDRTANVCKSDYVAILCWKMTSRESEIMFAFERGAFLPHRPLNFIRPLAHRPRVARASSDDVLNLLMKRNRCVATNVGGEKRSRNTNHARARENRLELVSLPRWIYSRRVEVDFNARKAMSNRNAFSVHTEFPINRSFVTLLKRDNKLRAVLKSAAYIFTLSSHVNDALNRNITK